MEDCETGAPRFCTEPEESAVANQRKAGSILLLLAAWVGIARVAANVHHPIDVIGSTLIALTTTFLCYRFLVDRIPFPRSPENFRGD